MILPKQAAQVFRNLTIALQSRGCDAADLVKLTVFLTDMNNLGSYREARNRFFASVTPPAAPAVTLVEVSKLYGADFMIEIEAIAIPVRCGVAVSEMPVRCDVPIVLSRRTQATF